MTLGEKATLTISPYVISVYYDYFYTRTPQTDLFLFSDYGYGAR